MDERVTTVANSIYSNEERDEPINLTQEQLIIIERLPENFIDQISHFVRTKEESIDPVKKELMINNGEYPEYQRNLVRTRLFEMLVRGHEQFIMDNSPEGKLLRLFNNPSVFGLEDVDDIPDIAFLKTDGGLVTTIGIAKPEIPDSNILLQLRDFPTIAKDAITKLNRERNINGTQGLDESIDPNSYDDLLASAPINVSENLIRIVVLTSDVEIDTDLTGGELENFLWGIHFYFGGANDEESTRIVEDCIKIIQPMIEDGTLEFYNSQFSSKELDIMAREVLAEIQE